MRDIVHVPSSLLWQTAATTRRARFDNRSTEGGWRPTADTKLKRELLDVARSRPRHWSPWGGALARHNANILEVCGHFHKRCKSQQRV